MYQFDKDEQEQIILRGSSLESVINQLNQFTAGVEFARLDRPAKIQDGIISFEREELENLIALYQRKQEDLNILKFVPASGAATRMFKELFQAIEINSTNESTKALAEGLSKLAFHNQLKNQHAKLNGDWSDIVSVCKTLLSVEGLNYGQLPKGLLKFHQYNDHERTPFYEQLIEGLNYAFGQGNRVKIHFTVSEDHEQGFEAHLNEILRDSSLSEVEFEISFSTQQKVTDTIAVDLGNNPFKKGDGTFLFRPGGHGALINNLNELEADVIFIKNIDNVVHDDYKSDTFIYKKVLAGVLLTYQQKIFDFLRELNGLDIARDVISNVESFIKEKLGTELSKGYYEMEGVDKKNYLIHKLNRPIRVCGMVQNTGEPGGGPFWVTDSDGSASLQIVESAQVDQANPAQAEILKQSTHFNPVDLVCAIRDFKGQKFDLSKFVDPNSGFITQKSVSGQDIKALEHPGLWNGAMAHWNTIFVEVPISTFNPVKTVIDLLKKEHLPAQI